MVAIFFLMNLPRRYQVYIAWCYVKGPVLFECSGSTFTGVAVNPFPTLDMFSTLQDPIEGPTFSVIVNVGLGQRSFDKGI